MFPTSDSAHNRLLALEQELLGWKRSPRQFEEHLGKNESWQGTSEEEHSFELGNGEDWDLKHQEILDRLPQHRRMHPQGDDERRSSFPLNEMSYAALARRLQDIPNEEIRHGHNRTPAQQKLLEPWTEEPPVSSPITSGIPIQANLPSKVENFVRDRLPFSTPESPSDLNIPTDKQLNALVTDDVSRFDDVAVPYLDATFLDSGSGLNLSLKTDSNEPSYTSLVRVIEEARRSSPSLTLSQFITEFITDDDDTEVSQQSPTVMLGDVASTSNQNTKTIDVEAHVISDVLDKVDPFSDIAFSADV